jgi:type IV secretion system protein VirB3
MGTPARSLTIDPLFVGATRPPMRWGVTYTALLVNLVVTMEAFLLTRNLLTLGIALPIHAVSAALCLRDARIFDLLFLWFRTHAPTLLANGRTWKAAGYSPLRVALPNAYGRRRVAIPTLWV